MLSVCGGKFLESCCQVRRNQILLLLTTSPADLSAEAVGSALLAAILGVCQEWAESLPRLTQVPGDIELSLYAIKNTRRKMEDRHAVCVDINSLFGLKVRCCSIGC